MTATTTVEEPCQQDSMRKSHYEAEPMYALMLLTAPTDVKRNSWPILACQLFCFSE